MNRPLRILATTRRRERLRRLLRRVGPREQLLPSSRWFDCIFESRLVLTLGRWSWWWWWSSRDNSRQAYNNGAIDRCPPWWWSDTPSICWIVTHGVLDARRRSHSSNSFMVTPDNSAANRSELIYGTWKHLAVCLLTDDAMVISTGGLAFQLEHQQITNAGHVRNSLSLLVKSMWQHNLTFDYPGPLTMISLLSTSLGNHQSFIAMLQ